MSKYGKKLLTCVICRKVRFIEDEDYEEITSQLRSYLNRRIEEGKIEELLTMCSDCKDKYKSITSEKED